MANSKEYVRYIFVILFVFVIYLAYLVIRPFITALLTSAILAYIFYPLYISLNKKIKNKNISALIISLLIIVLLAVPFIFMLNSLAKESQFVYIRAKQIFITGDIFSIGCAPDNPSSVCRFSNFLRDFISEPGIRYHLEDSLMKLTTSISEHTSRFIFSIPTIVLNIFVAFFTIFYLFKDGEGFMLKVKRLLPLKFHHRKQIFQQLDETTYAIIYGSLLVAAIQGAAGAIGFYLFGIGSPIAWGMLMAIFSLIPFIGTAVVWLPISIIVLIQGLSTDSSTLVMKGLGLLIYGALVISSIDNLIKPGIIGRRAGIHPVLVLLGALGGIAFFGFIGFIIGPLILALLITVIDIYEKEKLNGQAPAK